MSICTDSTQKLTAHAFTFGDDRVALAQDDQKCHELKIRQR
jgi:hypothetical protein